MGVYTCSFLNIAKEITERTVVRSKLFVLGIYTLLGLNG